ncbi:hypothetical protein DBR43_17520 [Pedobacter sp. KBW06]|uniref:LLM class flavin-dependent oxidoreductase n=1 Tax=Pedobacter sp. KBW06 TaxID=2153359 RepID=UPI000F592724|nr:LLM class flavin-dependent oxidoreductase [Pedobacter sp. KBW06]RQO69853.1 hypothetical protein DBR43_17520 [Pedobacter sp. KBW06]
MKIGILEFGNIEQRSGAEVLEAVLEYAQCADVNGFSRFWLTEHHPLSMGWNNPEMLLPTLACYTETIKIGIAGILSAIHTPYRVASSFKLLGTMFPGRIDLGFANGKPSPEACRNMLNTESLAPDIYHNFQEHVRKTHAFLTDEGPAAIAPYLGDLPEMWLLGASYQQLGLAAELGTGFSRSIFHTAEQPGHQAEKVWEHRSQFAEIHQVPPPLNIAFAGICDKDDRKAKKKFYELYQTEYDPNSNFIVGNPAYFNDRLSQMMEQTGIEEFIFKDLQTNNLSRMDTLHLLSKLISKPISAPTDYDKLEL